MSTTGEGRMKIAIICGGIGGLRLALALRQRGIPADVFRIRLGADAENQLLELIERDRNRASVIM